MEFDDKEASMTAPTVPAEREAFPVPEDIRDVWMTAPKRVWLDLGQPDDQVLDETYAGKNFRDFDEVTWSEDNATGWGIAYVRADLASSPPSQPSTCAYCAVAIDGAPPSQPADEAHAFEQLCREHEIAGTAAAQPVARNPRRSRGRGRPMTFATNADLYADLDLRSRHVRQKDDNEVAANSPEPGDYWHDHFAPVTLVIAVVGGQVATFEHTIVDRGAATYHYDTSKVTWRSLAEFKHWLSYKSIPGYWANVTRRSKRLEVIEDWRANGGAILAASRDGGAA